MLTLQPVHTCTKQETCSRLGLIFLIAFFLEMYSFVTTLQFKTHWFNSERKHTNIVKSMKSCFQKLEQSITFIISKNMNIDVVKLGRLHTVIFLVWYAADSMQTGTFYHVESKAQSHEELVQSLEFGLYM